MFSIRHKIRHPAVLLLLLLAALALAGCTGSRERLDPPRTVSDLAYDEKSDAAGRIWIDENGRRKPYLVLANDDSGTLLLREYVLDEPFAYRTDYKAMWPAYYPDSDIDRCLNSVFLEQLQEDVRASLLLTRLEVTSEEGMRQSRPLVHTIDRKVFILSAEELCCSLGHLCAAEGSSLSYFRKAERKRALHEDGSAAAWYTRTPSFTERNCVLALEGDGVVGLSPLESALGETLLSVRPAFRIPSDTPVALAEENGESHYVLDISA